MRDEADGQQGGASVRLVEVGLTANDVPAMIRFYDELFGARLEALPAYGTTFYRGTLHGVRFVIAPNDLAGVEADQNRHQFVYETSDLRAVLEAAMRAGGVVRDEADGAATVLDPDGNTIVFRTG